MLLAIDDWLYRHLVSLNLWSSSVAGDRQTNGVSEAVSQAIDETLPMGDVKHVVRWGTDRYHSMIAAREDKATDPDPILATRGRRAPFLAIRFLEDDYDTPHQAFRPASDVQSPASADPNEGNVLLSRHPIPVTIRYALEIHSPNPLFARRMAMALARDFQPRKKVDIRVDPFGAGKMWQEWPAVFVPEGYQSVLSISGSSRGDTVGDDAQRHRRAFNLRVEAFLVSPPDTFARVRNRYTTAKVCTVDDRTGDELETVTLVEP